MKVTLASSPLHYYAYRPSDDNVNKLVYVNCWQYIPLWSDICLVMT